ncbi:hypothetical protein Tco_0213783 [Tanacetum coccineum]
MSDSGGIGVTYTGGRLFRHHPIQIIVPGRRSRQHAPPLPDYDPVRDPEAEPPEEDGDVDPEEDPIDLSVMEEMRRSRPRPMRWTLKEDEDDDMDIDADEEG